jgi:hypothetical protein
VKVKGVRGFERRSKIFFKEVMQDGGFGRVRESMVSIICIKHFDLVFMEATQGA